MNVDDNICTYHSLPHEMLFFIFLEGNVNEEDHTIATTNLTLNKANPIMKRGSYCGQHVPLYYNKETNSYLFISNCSQDHYYCCCILEINHQLT